MTQPTKGARPNAVEVALGNALEWTIQRWVKAGRRVRTGEAPWLDGPVGTARIGPRYHEAYAREAGLETVADDPDAGLLADFGALAGGGFEPEKVHPEIRRFYERTARYGLDVTPEWRGLLRYPPRTLIYLVSRNIQQLNLPTGSSRANAGMTSELIRLSNPATGNEPYACWLRRSKLTGDVVYAGFYTSCELPGREGRFVKVVFPLPGGSATVILRPENRPDGSLVLVSAGDGFGDAGYYRVHRMQRGALRTRRVPMEETIHVYVDGSGALRTDHVFAFARVRFLTLRYGISSRNNL